MGAQKETGVGAVRVARKHLVRNPLMRAMADQGSPILGHNHSGGLGRLAIGFDQAFLARDRRVGQVRVRVNWESTTIGDASLAKKIVRRNHKRFTPAGFPTFVI